MMRFYLPIQLYHSMVSVKDTVTRIEVVRSSQNSYLNETVAIL